MDVAARKNRILVIAVIVAVIVVALILFGSYFKTLRLKSMELVYAKWFVTNYDTGGYTSLEIKEDGENAVIITEEQAEYKAEITRTTYTVAVECLEELADYIIKANIPIIADRGYSKVSNLLGTSYNLSCTFQKNDKHYDYSVEEWQKMLHFERVRVSKIEEYLYSLISAETGITETIVIK